MARAVPWPVPLKEINEMTIPTERTNSVLGTAELLMDLMNSTKYPGVPMEVRERARWCLRHFPTRFDLEQSAAAASDVWGPPPPKLSTDRV